MALKIDIKPTSDLGDLPAKIKQALYKGIAEATILVESEAKKNFGGQGQLKVRSGRLRSSIKAESNKAEGSVSTNVIYGAVHEVGATIRQKKAPYLVFEAGGRTRRVRQVVIPARPYLFPAVEDNIDSITKLITNRIMEAMDGN